MPNVSGTTDANPWVIHQSEGGGFSNMTGCFKSPTKTITDDMWNRTAYYYEGVDTLIFNANNISNQYQNNLNEVRVKSIISNGYIRLY